MKSLFREIGFATERAQEVIAMTDEILAVAAESGIENGILLAQLEKFAPQGVGYRHSRIDENAHAHLRAAFAGASQTLPIVNGRVVRGSWQSFLVIEQDGPRPQR